MSRVLMGNKNSRGGNADKSGTWILPWDRSLEWGFGTVFLIKNP